MRISWPKPARMPSPSPGVPPSADADPPAHGRSLARRFADLKVRPKLMLLHNLFFLVLSVSIYLALIPQFEERVTRAKLIEVSLLTQIFGDDRPGLRLPQMSGYDYREGSAQALQIPPDVKVWVDAHPGEVWQDASVSDYLFRKDLGSGAVPSPHAAEPGVRRGGSAGEDGSLPGLGRNLRFGRTSLRDDHHASLRLSASRPDARRRPRHPDGRSRA